MKLNRRNALVAATAFAAGYGQPRLQTASAEKRTPNANSANADRTHVASIAAECAAACNASLDACTQQQLSSTKDVVPLIAAIRDCGDICTVTATQLANTNSMAPALRQACADACQRMVTACQDFQTINTVPQCSVAAVRCAAACLQSIA